MLLLPHRFLYRSLEFWRLHFNCLIFTAPFILVPTKLIYGNTRRNQLYEMKFTDSALLLRSTEAQVTIKKVFYIYLGILGIILLGKQVGGLISLSRESDNCLHIVNDYNPYDMSLLVYMFMWFSVAILPGWYLYYM